MKRAIARARDDAGDYLLCRREAQKFSRCQEALQGMGHCFHLPRWVLGELTVCWLVDVDCPQLWEQHQPNCLLRACMDMSGFIRLRQECLLVLPHGFTSKTEKRLSLCQLERYLPLRGSLEGMSKTRLCRALSRSPSGRDRWRFNGWCKRGGEDHMGAMGLCVCVCVSKKHVTSCVDECMNVGNESYIIPTTKYVCTSISPTFQHH